MKNSTCIFSPAAFALQMSRTGCANRDELELLIASAVDEHAQLYRALEDVTSTLASIAREGALTVADACRKHENLVGTSLYNARYVLAETVSQCARDVNKPNLL